MAPKDKTTASAVPRTSSSIATLQAKVDIVEKEKDKSTEYIVLLVKMDREHGADMNEQRDENRKENRQ